MPRRFSTRGFSKHLNYRVDEASRILGCSKATIRNWIKSGKLEAMTERKPFLLRGDAIIHFLHACKQPSTKCALDECYCVKCRGPRHLHSARRLITISKGGRPQLRGDCEVCGTTLLKPIKRSETSALAALLGDSLKRVG